MNTTVNILNVFDYLYPNNTFLVQIKNTLLKFPESEIALADALSLGQLQSKIWLINNLPSNLGTVFICAGWYGTLAALMFERANDKFDKIRSFDIDKSCASIADNVNRPWVIDGWIFKAITQDIMDIDYTGHSWQGWSNINQRYSFPIIDTPDTIINTSCEHIENFEDWYAKIPVEKLIILQSNNYFEITDHINCVNNLDEFAKQSPMNTLIYEGELQLPKYKRFMRIGFK